MLKKMSVAIVDDHFAIREGYKSVMQTIDYVGLIDDFGSSVDLYLGLKMKFYDFILLDTELKNESGLDICKRLKQTYKEIKIIMLDANINKQHILKAEEYNADGYLSKDGESHEVRKAMQDTLIFGKKYYSLAAKEIIFDYEHIDKRPTLNQENQLTAKEIEVLKLICKGMSNKEISAKLSRNETTIAKHRQNIMRKLNVHKTIELINIAIVKGIYSPHL